MCSSYYLQPAAINGRRVQRPGSPAILGLSPVACAAWYAVAGRKGNNGSITSREGRSQLENAWPLTVCLVPELNAGASAVRIVESRITTRPEEK